MSDESTNEPVDEGLTNEVSSPSAAAVESDAPPDSVDAESKPGGVRGRRRRPGRAALVVAVVAVAGTFAAAGFWWQYGQPPDALSDEDLFVLESLEDANATLLRLQDGLDSVRGEIGTDRAQLDTLSRDVEALPTELRALRREVETLEGGRLDARESWLREQAKYYLLLANTELDVARRLDSAISALELANDVLRDLGDPGLTDVRAAIALELQSLRAVEIPDFDGYLAELAGLIARVAELPMRAAAPENFGSPEESLDDVEPGLGRLWARTKGAVTSIVRVERQDEPVGPVLTDAERRILRRQLALELQIARAALFERNQATLRASLVAADGILNREFDRGAQSVIEARTLLSEMMRVELEPPLPDISDSLTLLRNATGAD